MPFCHKCGKANQDDARFCEACGARMVVPAPAPAAAALVEAATTAEATAAPGAAAAESTAPPTSTRCASCDQMTPAGLAFCQNCGRRLAPSPLAHGATPSAAGVPGRVASAPTPVDDADPADEDERVDPAATVRLEPAGSGGGGDAAVTTRIEPTSTPHTVPRAEPAAARIEPMPAVRSEPTVLARVETVSRPDSRRTPSVGVRAVAPGITRSEPRAAGGPSRGRVVVVRDGRDVEAHSITGDTFDVGRGEGQLVVANDAHLAHRHARFTTPLGAPPRIRPLDTVNGVFLRVQGGVDLVPGDVILVGRQLLRYESVGSEERDPPTTAEHGVRVLGSATREAWGRLRQLTSAGTTRDMWHLCATEITIGRRGEVSSDDPDLADRHAVLRRGTGRARIEDLGTPGGTFVRLRGERELRGGELLRIGEQLVRFEAAGQASA